MNIFLTALAALLLDTGSVHDRPFVIVVVGAAGTPEYATAFEQWAERWQAAANAAEAKHVRIGLDASQETTDRERLKLALAEQEHRTDSPLWLVLIGHGTFDGRVAKFNLRGPDVSAAELSQWLKPFQRPLAVVNCASSSGPFINRLSASERVIVTATKSGNEQNYARFGDYLSSAIADPAADLDKDQQTSLLEAFLSASKQVAEFYDEEGRLATEHALIDDNADGLGTPGDWFRGVRATRRANEGASVDGLSAGQFVLVRSQLDLAMPADVRARRDALEQAVAALREKKSEMSETVYYAELEPLLLELARIYQQTDDLTR